MAATLRGGSIYCEAVLPPEDVYFEGSEDEDYDNAAERRKRYEAAGQKFLSGSVPFLLSASLKGPFDEASGWVNPWRSKNRTAHSHSRPESAKLGAQCTSPMRPATSASASTATQAIEVLKNAECALPSPESLKQAPFTATPSRLRGKVADEDRWGDGMASLTSTKDDTDPWMASSPSRKLKKKRSKSSIGANSTSKKRQKTETTEIETQTPTSGRRATRSNADELRTNTKADMRNSSIYAHIRELTSKFPRQDLSSDDEIAFDDDDSDALLTSQSVPSSSANLVLSPWKDSSSEALRQRLNPHSSFSSPPRRLGLAGALSPVSMSSAQTPTKRTALSASSPGRLPSMNGSSASRTPTRTLRFSDMDMLDMDGADGDSAIGNTMAPETQSQEQELPSLRQLDVNDVNHVNGTPDPISRAATAYRPDCEATTSRHAQDDSILGPKTSPGKLDSHLKPIRATPPRQVTHPVIYDDAKRVNRSSPGSSITAPSSSQQPAASQNEVAKSPSDSKLTKTSKFPKSSALQSLSPRNGRINSRPALKKAVRSYMSSPLKPSTSSVNRSYLHKEDGQLSKENVETKDANESASLLTRSVNISASQPEPDEVLATSTPEADPSKASAILENHSAPKAESPKADKVQQGPSAPDAAAPLLSPFGLAPPGITEPTVMDDTVQGAGQSNVPELVEPSFIQEELPAQSESSIPLADAGLGTPEMQASEDTSENPDVSDSTGPAIASHTPTQEQQKQTLGPIDAAKSPVLPPQSVETHQSPSEDMPPPSDKAFKRPSTPEPQFAFTSFSSFMSPSPSHRRQVRYSWDGAPNGVGPTSRGILLSSKKGPLTSTASKKRVSWAPLPHEETASTGEETASETNTSSSPSRGRDRAVSPPPPPSTSLASDSLEERDMNFSHHFAAVADRTKGTQPQSAPTASGDGSYGPGMETTVTAAEIASWTEVTNSPKMILEEVDKGAAKLTGGWDGGEEATDIVEDIFNEMDDFLQVWDVDAELKEARKADKARAAGEKKQDEGMLEADAGMAVDMDMTSQFFF
ncbi:hypothetical protein BBK36DRAFT_1143426 [Trichoderma citrinoviride]|uniref:Protamine P1 n=1 Tax=Trichoderma citrinoviride TaxID=58853 RepID=A0A2T4B305_9HYPO|nr:hypothetical protein BBK36DRAFT_1143426 [Trichoderma citrinoviride]PTB63712.1 hypothetical protein BBK36DRAFT_1143426 [Trichoderma citrinoviride]